MTEDIDQATVRALPYTEEAEAAASRAIARHEAQHSNCNERYWYERAQRHEAAARHFFSCEECKAGGLCRDGVVFARMLGFVS